MNTELNTYGVGYAYPTSDIAQVWGMSKTGCWYVFRSYDGGHQHYICAYPRPAQAEHAMRDWIHDETQISRWRMTRRPDWEEFRDARRVGTRARAAS